MGWKMMKIWFLWFWSRSLEIIFWYQINMFQIHITALWCLNLKSGIALNREHRIQEDQLYDRLPGHDIEHMLESRCQIDLEPSLGSKSRQEIKFKAQNMPKPFKFWKTWKSRKTAENFIIHQIFDLKNKFSLCWRSKSCKSRSQGVLHMVRSTLSWHFA